MHHGRHRETIGPWLKGVAADGLAGSDERPGQILLYLLGLGRRHAYIFIRERLKAVFVMSKERSV